MNAPHVQNKPRRRRTSNADGSLTEVVRKEHVAFAKDTAAAMLALGAKQTRDAGMNERGCFCVSMGDFRIDTTAGSLLVHAYGNCVFTCFDDAEAGYQAVGASRPSGKWNFHTFDAGLEMYQADPDRATLKLFLRHLAPILREPQKSVAERIAGIFHVETLGSDGAWKRAGSVALTPKAPAHEIESVLSRLGLYAPRGADKLEWSASGTFAVIHDADGAPMIRLWSGAGTQKDS